MKRLYNCTAWYDKSTLLSYNTEVIKFNDNIATLRVYRSTTTMQHIRKYERRLSEIGEYNKAHVVKLLYNAMLKYRSARYITCDLNEYIIVVEC